MYDLRDLITVGLGAQVTHVVRDSDAASNYSEDLKDFLSTPAVIGLAIQATGKAVEAYMPEGFVSIGRFISFEHTASTRVGMKITVEARVVEVTEQLIVFEVKARDELGEVGFGTHKRSIVVKDYLTARSKRREAMASNSRMS